MTTVVVDRKLKLMCADNQLNCDGQKVKHRKITKHDNVIIGHCGVSEAGEAFRLWFKIQQELSRGIKPEEHKDAHYPRTDDFSAIVLGDNGKLLWYGKLGYPVEIKDRFFGIGSGSEYALGAIHAGASLKEAVRIANKLDVNSGLGISSLSFKKKQSKRTK